MKRIKFFIGIFVVSLVYFNFFETNSFSTISSLKIKNSNNNQFEIQLLPVFSSASDEVYEFREFLISPEGIGKLKEIIMDSGIENDFYPNLLDLNKRYLRDFDSYILKFFDLNVDPNTNIFKITTTSYTPKSSQYLNKTIILLMQYYFDRKQRLSSLISSTNSICNFVSQNKEIRNLEMPVITEELYSMLSDQNSINVILEVNKIKRDECLNEASFLQDSNVAIEKIPQQLSSGLNYLQSEEILKEYIMSEKSINLTSDKILLVSNPILADSPDNKRPIVKSILLAVALLLAFLAIRILIILFSQT